MKYLLIVLSIFLASDALAARPGKRPCPARAVVARPSAKVVAKPKSAPARTVAHSKAPIVATRKPALPASRGSVGKPVVATKGAPAKHVAPKPAPKPVVKATPKSAQIAPKPSAPALTLKANPFVQASPEPVVQIANGVRKPAADDPDWERVTRLQEALTNATRSGILGRLRVGIRVEDVLTGKLLFDHRGHALMDPASNQKVLATAAALLRLGGEYRFRTDVVGNAPDGDGRIMGDVVLRGSGDPSLRLGHFDDLAKQFVRRGVTNVLGNVLADTGYRG